MAGEIQVLAQARNRLLRGGRHTLVGALTDKPDSELLNTLIEETYTRRGKNGKPLEAVELEIAERLDAGDDYPVGNPEAFQGVMWLAQTDPANLPDPMPRDFALYFAIAWKNQGRFPTVTAGLQSIYDNFQFV